jgi:hypothetical protein
MKKMVNLFFKNDHIKSLLRGRCQYWAAPFGWDTTLAKRILISLAGRCMQVIASQHEVIA